MQTYLSRYTFDFQKEALEKIEKAKAEYFESTDESDFIGEVGKRIDLDLTLTRICDFEVASYRGYGTEIMFIYSFEDKNGNVLIWKTSRLLGKKTETRWTKINEGETFRCKATVKEHSVYRDKKQTVLTRLKVC